MTGDLTADSVRSLLVQPEGLHLEFKRDATNADQLATIVTAFANTDGGTIVLGAEPSRAVGLAHPGVVADFARQTVDRVHPPLEVAISDVEVEDGRHVVVIQVPKGDRFPYLADGRIVERRGDRVAPITSERVTASLTPLGVNESGRIAGAIAEQSETVERLTSEMQGLNARLSWRGQLPMQVGMVGLGIVLTKAFDYIVG